ncbi:MAG: heavy metal translocating P-type ATPase [Trueperaceae bacterium]|nr:heavy metal translocating P-type ATPase [Trueperaceae bacterium]
MSSGATLTTDGLLAELARERRQVRLSAAFTGLTALGLATAIVIGLLAPGALGAASGWPARLLAPGGVGGAGALGGAATVAALGLLLAFLAGGLPAGIAAGRALVEERKLDIDLLMVLAALAAALVGEARDGAILLFLFSLANTLEANAFSNTRRAVASLMELKPETATLMVDGAPRQVPAATVAPGAVILVRPGERVPLDGVVLEGVSSLDQSPITGEAVPVDKGVGDALFAGSVNGHGALRVRVTKDASSSTLARMIELVTEAQATRSPSQRFGDWFGERYTVLVLLGTGAALAAFLLLGMERQAAFYKAATLLVVASPCAVVISVPAAVLSALARAARMGVLFKGGAALEEFGAVDVMAFDKTGTLTQGRMRVAEVVPFGVSAASVLELAGAIEASSEHAVAQAIVAAAGRPDAPPLVEGVTAVPGMGIRATVDGAAHWAGNRRLAANVGVPTTPEVEATLALLEGRGHTTVMVGDARRVIGVVAVADTVRATAGAAIRELRARGVERIVMLTGDHPEAAHAVADELGIAAAEVNAGLLPEEKVARVRELAGGGRVAFVGDGVNDAAALAVASVGVAMGVAGSDAALEAADVALLSDDLARLPEAHDLARRANRVIRQNLAFALGIMLVMVVTTLVARLPLPLGVLGHEGGTILVVMNGLRLLGPAPRAGRAAPSSARVGELARPG